MATIAEARKKMTDRREKREAEEAAAKKAKEEKKTKKESKGFFATLRDRISSSDNRETDIDSAVEAMQTGINDAKPRKKK
jgi:septal ring factor EnvC (AmiA/AmiB activator)